MNQYTSVDIISAAEGTCMQIVLLIHTTFWDFVWKRNVFGICLRLFLAFLIIHL